jgi:isopropylmalate/homocitrate/citramalate synthase
MKSVLIRDSTLREGLELPGVELSLAQKLKVALMLEKMHVPEIEIGMPYGIRGCLPLAAAIKSRGLRIRTSALILAYRASCREEIDIAAASSLDRVELLIPTSDTLLNLQNYYKISRDGLPGLLRDGLAYAKKRRVKVGLGFVDATRTDLDVLVRLMRVGRTAGADRVILYDTTGVATPELMTAMVSGAKRECPLPIIVHCHNDFGLATANTLAGLAAGAAGADVVTNGLGDRGGNAALEEVVLALEVLHGVRTGVRLENVTALSQLVEDLSGIKKCRVKAVVGEFTFLHSPVMHIRNAASGNRRGFEPFEPEAIGAVRKFAFTLPVDYSDALEPFCGKLGLAPKKSEVAAILAALREASRERGLSEKEILSLIRKTVRRTPTSPSRG